MNVRHYVKFAAVSVDRIQRHVGIDDEYRAQRRLSAFTAEQYTRYLAELHGGDLWSARTLLVDRSTKAAHLLAFVVNDTRKRLAATVEIMQIHVNMDLRCAVDFPADVARRIDSQIASANRSEWPLPLSGVMSVATRRTIPPRP